jgi:REP element-mobilizing transposase RayT
VWRQGKVRRISRLPRIEVEDGIYHVVARGNERRAIFEAAADRERFLEIVEQAARRYRVHVLAYCLMSNHYHLLLQTPQANLARTMRQLNGVYAQDFNSRRGRSGHLFEGRYGARLVQADEHLAATLRYIVRNPLRARMCEQLDEWRWSSHGATCGLRPPGFLAVDRLLGYLGASGAEGRARYLALVGEGEDLPRSDHPLVAGDEHFFAAHLERVRPSPEHPRRALRPPRPPLAELVGSVADEVAIARANLDHGYSMREIATHLGCGIATVHRRVKSSEGRAGTWKT